MKLKIKKDFLVSRLEAFKNIIPQKPAILVLTNIVVKVNDEGIEIKGTDGSLSGVMRISPNENFESVGEDTFLINYFNLRDIATKVVGDVIEMDTTESVVNLKAGRSKYKLTRMDIAQYTFPKTPEVLDGCTVSRADFVYLINKTSFAVDGKEASVPLQGICMVANPSQIKMYGTDRRKIAAVSSDKIKSETSLEILVHVDYMKKIGAIVSLFDNEEINIKKSGNTAVYEIGNDMSIYASTIAAKSPNYESILGMPVEFKEATINKEDFIALLKRTIIVSTNRDDGVTLTFEDGSLTALVKSENGSCEESMPIEFKAEKHTMNIAVPYLLQAFGSYDEPVVNVMINTQTNQLSIFKENLKYLIASRRTYN